MPKVLISDKLSPAAVEIFRRRGVEVIVLAAEESSRVRGGALLGGRPGAREGAIGEITKYVIAKAPCPVILTAPARDAAPVAPVATDAGAVDGATGGDTGSSATDL